MVRRKLTRIFFVVAVFGIFSPVIALATPVIDGVYFFSENSVYMTGGWGYQFGISDVYDDISGNSIVAVVATQIDDVSLSFNLSYDGSEWFYAGDLPAPPVLTQMEIVATNNLGESSSYITNLLDPVRLLDRATNIQVSGALLSPEISWDPVEYATSYRIRISGSAGIVFDSRGYATYANEDMYGDFITTSYAMPVGILAAGEQYRIRISANEVDDYLLNRSSELYDYSTANTVVPEPSSALLFCVGLLLLSLYSRRVV